MCVCVSVCLCVCLCVCVGVQLPITALVCRGCTSIYGTSVLGCNTGSWPSVKCLESALLVLLDLAGNEIDSLSISGN